MFPTIQKNFHASASREDLFNSNLALCRSGQPYSNITKHLCSDKKKQLLSEIDEGLSAERLRPYLESPDRWLTYFLSLS